MTERISNLIVKDTSWSKITKLLIILTIGLICMDISFPIIFRNDFHDENFLRFFIELMIAYNFIFLLLHVFIILFISPIQKTTILISKEKLKIYLSDKLFLQIRINETAKLELIKVGWVLGQEGYTIIFNGSNFKETLRLGLFIFKTKKQKLIVNYLKQVSEELGINCIEMRKIFDNFDALEKDSIKVQMD